MPSDDTSHKREQPDAGETCEVPRGANGVPCDACGTPMKPMGHCKYWCLTCGFQRTCNDVI